MSAERAKGWGFVVGVACAGAVAVAGCDGLLGTASFHESACYPEATCPDDAGGDSTAPGVDAESGADVDAEADAGSVDAADSARDGGDGSPDAEGGMVQEAGCPSDTLACDGGCVPNDTRNCGTCGNDCTNLPHVSGQVACGAGGVCEFDAGACATGYAHCSGGASAGCETPVDTASNCGACGAKCSGTMPDCSGSGSSYSCTSGCSGSLELCGSTCVDTTQDTNNCGTCNDQCTTSIPHSTPNCMNGTCGYGCNGGYSPCNGGCADFANDSNNCGTCGNACSPGTICSGGHCVCNTISGCNGCCRGTTCDTFGSQSTSSCGYGGTACGGCSVSGEICASVSNGGSCQCPGGDTMCNSACVNTQTDSNNCGSCGTSCSSIAGSSCVSGECSCPSGEQNCSGTCANEQTDSNNCGMCGHSCLGGTCSAGVCQPTLLAPAASYSGETCDAVDGLTTDGTNVYWTAFCTNHTVDLLLSAPAAGNRGMAGNQLYLSKGIGDVEVLNGALYWIYGTTVSGHTTSAIQSCSPGNCSSPSSLGSSVYANGGFTSNGSKLYWWASGSQIDWCNIASCSTTTYTSTASNPGATLETIAANATTVFWLDTTAGGVVSCQTNASLCVNSTTIISGRSGLGALAVDSSNVYWSDSAGVLECPIIGCGSPVVLGAGQTANSIGTDGTHVYWTTGSSVVRATIGQANSATTIAPNETGAAYVGVGPSAVYWGLSNGDIAMLAK